MTGDNEDGPETGGNDDGAVTGGNGGRPDAADGDLTAVPEEDAGSGSAGDGIGSLATAAEARTAERFGPIMRAARLKTRRVPVSYPSR